MSHLKVKFFLLLTCATMINGCQSDNQLNVEDWFKKGLISEKETDYGNAIKAYTKALEINPRIAKSIYIAGPLGVSRTTLIKLSSISLQP